MYKYVMIYTYINIYVRFSILHCYIIKQHTYLPVQETANDENTRRDYVCGRP